MPDAIIELRRVDKITVMTLSAGKANALDATLLEAITSTVDRVIADGAQALVITGEGNSFSGGLALPSLIDLDRAAIRGLMKSLRVAMQRVLQAPIPTVAATSPQPTTCAASRGRLAARRSDASQLNPAASGTNPNR